MRLLVVVFVWIGFMGSSTALAEPPADALRYHEVLQKRPDSATVFTRFVETWLAESDEEALIEFLEKTYAETEALSDGLILARLQELWSYEESAERTYRALVEAFPDQGLAWIQLAKLGIRRGNLSESIPLLRNALETELPDLQREETWLLLGRQLVREGEMEQAMELLEKLLASAPGSETYRDVIDLFAEQGRLEEAVATAERWLEGSTDATEQAEANLRIAELELERDAADAGLERLDLVLEKSGQDSWLERTVLAKIEEAFRDRDDVEGLSEHLRTLTEKYPRRLSLNRQSAWTLAELGEAEEADAAFQNVVRLTPGELEVREEYVALLEQLDRIDQAVEQAASLAETHRVAPDWYLRIAGLHFLANDLDAAEAMVETFLEKSGGDLASRLIAARELEQFRRLEAAEEQLRSLVDEAPGLETHLQLAEFLNRRGRRDEAIESWRAAAEAATALEAMDVARQLSQKGELLVAFEMLLEQRDELKNNPLWIQLAAQQAIRVRRAEEMIPDVRRLVMLSDTEQALGEAVELARGVLKAAGQLQAVSEELEAKSPRAIQETSLLAEIYQSEGKKEQALEILRAAEELGDEAQLALGQQIRLLTLSFEWEAAAETATRAMELSGGTSPTAMARATRLFQSAGSPEEALDWAEKWQNLQPSNPAPVLRVAQIQEEMGRRDAARRTLNSAVRRFPDETTLRVNLARLLADMKRYPEAERQYRELYERAETETQKLRWVQDWAATAKSSGRLPLMVSEFRIRLQRSPRSLRPLMALARLNGAVGNSKAELDYLRQALSIEPRHLDLHLQLAALEERGGDIGQAEQYLQRARRFDRSGKATAQLAGLFFRHGEETRGYRLMLENSARLNDPAEIERTVLELLEETEWDIAGELLEAMLPDFPDEFRLVYLQGVLLEELGSFGEARKVFRQLVKSGAGGAMDVADRYGQVPADMAQILRQRDVEALAWAYRRHPEFAWTPFGSVPTGLAWEFGMPLDRGQAAELALAHLRGLGGETLRDDLAALGVEAADLLAAWSPHGGNAVAELFQNHPENPAAIALRLLDGPLDAATATRVRSALASAPALALLADVDIGAMEQLEVPAPLPPGIAVALAERLHRLEAGARFAAGSALKGALYQAWTASASVDERAQWFRALALVESDAGALADLMSAELAEWRASPSALSSARPVRSFSDGIEFPPRGLADYPEWLFWPLRDGVRCATTRAARDELLAGIDDGILRAVLGELIGQPHAVAELAWRVGAEPDAASPDERRFASTWIEATRPRKEAIEFLRRLAEREGADDYFAIRVVERTTTDPDVFRDELAGIEGNGYDYVGTLMQRIMESKSLSGLQRADFLLLFARAEESMPIGAMVGFEEVLRWARRGTVPFSSGGGGDGDESLVAIPTSRLEAEESIADLISDKRYDPAASLAAHYLHEAAADLLGGDGGEAAIRCRPLSDVAEGLASRIVDPLYQRAGNELSLRRLAAATAELLGREGEAKLDYRAILRRDPRDLGVRTRLYEMGGDLDLLREAPDDQVGEMLQRLRNGEREAPSGVLVKLLEEDTEGFGGLPIFAEVAWDMAQQATSSDSLGVFETARGWFTRVEGSRHDIDRLREIHEFSDRLLDTANGVAAFPLQGALGEHRGLESGELADAARRALSSATADSERRFAEGFDRLAGDAVIPWLHPAVYLIRDSWRGGDDLVGGADLGDYAGLQELYSCAAQDFAARARDFVGETVDPLRLDYVALAWVDRQQPADLAPLFREAMTTSPAFLAHRGSGVRRWLDVVAASEPAVAAELFADLAELAGPLAPALLDSHAIAPHLGFAVASEAVKREIEFELPIPSQIDDASVVLAALRNELSVQPKEFATRSGTAHAISLAPMLEALRDSPGDLRREIGETLSREAPGFAVDLYLALTEAEPNSPTLRLLARHSGELAVLAGPQKRNLVDFVRGAGVAWTDTEVSDLQGLLKMAKPLGQKYRRQPETTVQTEIFFPQTSDPFGSYPGAVYPQVSPFGHGSPFGSSGSIRLGGGFQSSPVPQNPVSNRPPWPITQP